MDETRVRELTEKSSVELRDYIIVEDNDGTKISSIRALKTVINNNTYFDTVADMKKSIFNEDDICFTMGYRTKYDGGAARYCMIYAPYTPEDEADIIHLETSDNVRAKLIPDSQSVNLQQFGAYGDGVHDDTKYIEKALSTGKEIIFGNDKVYRITNPIKIKSNQKVNFNWCKIYPINCTAISIVSGVKNVSLENINIDCMNSSSGISIGEGASNIQIDGFNILNLNTIYKGITISNSINVRILNGYIEGLSIAGTGMVIESITITDSSSYYHIQNIWIDNIHMKNLDRYVYSNNQNKITNISFSGCFFEGSVGDTSPRYGYYLAGISDNIKIKNQVSNNIKIFFYASSSCAGNVTIEDASIYNSSIIYDQSSTNTSLIFKGVHNYNGNVNGLIVLNKLLGQLYIDTSATFTIDNTRYKSIGSLKLQGKLLDMQINTENMNMITITPTSNTSTLSIDSFRNMYINWASVGNVDSITGGIEGQIIYIVSTSNRLISTKNNIILFASDINLNLNYGVKLQLISGKWTQIQ